MNLPLTSSGSHSTRPRLVAWGLALVAALLLAVLSAAPPHVPEGLRGAIMHGFHLACHQQPDRSFATHDIAWALCHRCTGILGGLLLGLLVTRSIGTSAQAFHVRDLRKPLLIGTIALVSLDWTLGAVGVYDLVATRVATGALFGCVAGFVLGEALAWGHVSEEVREQGIGGKG
ncbi:MAG: DUF2085 domain-containing protein [Pseudomonadota bacterium]